MAITQVGSTVSNTARNGGNATLTLPAALQDDVVILIGSVSNAHATAPPTAAGPSTAGYTQIILDHTDIDVGTQVDDWQMFGAWYKVMGATPDTSVVGVGNGAGANACVYHAIVLRGADTASVIDAVSAFVRVGGTAAPDPPAVTVVTAGAWVFACGALGVNDTTATGPTGYSGFVWTIEVETNIAGCGFAYKEAAGAGSEDPGAFSGLDPGLSPGAFTFAVKPAGGGGGATDLVVADSAHAHTSESPTIAQVHALAPVDSLHAHAADVATLTQVHVLAPTDSAHGHTTDTATLTQAHALTAADSTHGHASTSPALTQAGDLAASDTAHPHASDSPTLTQAHVLAPADSAHASTSTSPTLATGTTLQPADTVHAHTVETPALTQLHVLDPARTVHANAADLAALTQAHQLAALDSLLTHTTDSPTVAGVEPSTGTPPSRTLVVPAESRALTVPAEPRTLVVPAENRTIPPESRTTTA